MDGPDRLERVASPENLPAMISQSRRQFLSVLGPATVALGMASPHLALSADAPPSAPSPEGKAPLRLDFHVHLFGVGDGGTGCRLSEPQRRHVNYFYLTKLLGLANNGRMDQDYVSLLAQSVRTSSIQRVLLQAWDSRYDEAGLPDWTRTTSLYIPNEYMFRVVGEHPDVFLPCASINPKRRDWKEEVDRCAEKGARLVKVHPPTMDVDPREARFRPFYRHCSARGMTLMFHTGAEHAADIVNTEVCDVARLEPALEEGCTVIAAHAGMGNFFDRVDYFPALVELARRHPRLYFDNSVLATMFRWRNLPRILDTPEIIGRAIHGSDFPFPANAAVFWSRLPPATVTSLLEERNLIERDYQLKRALGFPEAVFTRGADLLTGSPGLHGSQPA